jgi:hypothetical protein
MNAAPRMDPLPRWTDLWRDAGWPARGLFLGLLALFVSRAVHEPPSRCDLGGFLDIGAGVLDGRLRLGEPFANSYPPTFSVAMAPLAALSRAVGERAMRHLWGLAQLAALSYLTLGFARLLALQLSLGALAMAWLCTWRYVVGDLNNQNLSLILWALTTLALTRAAQGRAALGGALLGFGASLKIMPGFAALALLEPGAEGRGRFLLGAGAAMAGMVGLTALALGPGFGPAADFWLTRVVPSFGGDWAGNQGWNGLLQRLAPASPMALAGLPTARLLGMLAGLLLLGGVAALLFLRPAASPRVRALDAALAILAGLPALPITWFHYYTATLPVALAVTASWRGLRRGPRRAVVALFAGGTLLGAFLDADLVGTRAWLQAARYGNALFGALLVLAAGLLLRASWLGEDGFHRPAGTG